jgi:hypothetical protein
MSSSCLLPSDVLQWLCVPPIEDAIVLMSSPWMPVLRGEVRSRGWLLIAADVN